ncbi:uncharacterized protein LOC124302902 [Neodiprion virginianus]|uniref:uncharacterized protein LOC124302902 n=1 Tax=Neodiprion virginianus TaxID=2961670 RepID=UPI001EE77D7A|nr:uncharacterized protein LOC124302902 [Neodiprion virginianus]
MTIKVKIIRNLVEDYSLERFGKLGEADPTEVEAGLQKVYDLWETFNITQSSIEEIDETEARIEDSCRSSNCKRCGKRHNTALHIEEFHPKNNSNSDQSTTGSGGPSNSGELSNNVTLSSVRTNKTSAMLSTTLILVNDKFGEPHVCRAVLDCGSQSNFLTKALHSRLQLPERSENVSISGVNLSQAHTKQSVNATIKSRVNAFKIKLPFLVIDNITQALPTTMIRTQEFRIPDNITLADPSFNIPGEIDVLLGAGVFWDLLCVGQHIVSRNQPRLHKTKLGWIVGGSMAAPNTQSENARSAICCFTTETTLHKQIERLWSIEEYQPTKHFSEEELRCEEDFVAAHHRDEHGRFTVALSFRESPEQLGESKDIAIKRLRALNRKLEKQPELKKQYEAFLDEYIALGHMTEISDTEKTIDKPRCYIPHHCVVKESSTTTKVRVVFDASCKTTSGKSLNEILRVGPTIQQDLFAILARFRQHQYVLSAVIQKMYRQIKTCEVHRDFQRIVWRADSQQTIKEYKLNTVTYGTATAPFLAIRSLRQLAYDCKEEFPEISDIILRDFYVDDLLTGCDDVTNLKMTKQELERVLLSGGFPLCKWASNVPSIVNASPEDDGNTERPIGEEVTTLGLIWNPRDDTFRYRTKLGDISSRPTKRNVLSTISQIYDSLGLIGPAYISAKIILQQLWKLKIGWDESLLNDLHEAWKRYHTHLTAIKEISIPRAGVCQEPTNIELHGFCDASEAAYGACIYIRSCSQGNQYTTRLLCAKSRVAPLKNVSLPRLELCGAVLLARLAQKITQAFTLQIDTKYYWSDSKIALSWIAGEACQWKTFVANRVAEIHELTDKARWRHVRSEENPADVISRGTTPDQLRTHELWWIGPAWLLGPVEDYHGSSTEIQNEDVTDTTLLEAKQGLSSLTAIVNDFDLLERRNGPLSVDELKSAEKTVIAISQAERFPRAIHNLRKELPVPTNSKLASLLPFIDVDGLIRVGGRLQEAELPYAQRFPIVLAPSSALTRLIIRDAHLRNLHAGLQALLGTLNETFWILSARSTVKQVLSKCVTCFRFRPKALQQITGNLPSVRVNPSRAFLNVGVDYGGPFRIKISRNKTDKAYLCLFV